MSIKSALRDWLSASYSMLSILVIGSLRSPPKGETAEWYMKYMTLCFSSPYFSFPLEGNSRAAGKGVRGRAPIGWSIAVLTANRRPPERSDATFLHNPWHQGPEARWMPYAPLRRRRRPLPEYWKAPPRSRSRPRHRRLNPHSPKGLVRVGSKKLRVFSQFFIAPFRL